VLNSSRSGIAVLVLGAAFWLCALTFLRHFPSRLALGAFFLFLLVTALLVFGEQSFQRFHLRILDNADISSDVRWRIFHDTLRLIRDSPWPGIGFGNFESILAVFRGASVGDPRASHPESDWLWLWAEAGWPAVLITVLGIALFVSRVFPLRDGTNQRYRLAAFIAALLLAIRGIVDVSGHRMGTAFAAIFLVGLALHRPLSLKANRWVSILFRVVG